MTSAMAGIIQANNAAMTSAMQTLLTRMDDRVDAKLAENKADADAKLAENKADADAKLAEKLAENKADADAKLAEKLAENKADADAKLAEKLAENKSDIDAWLAENKADADAQMAGVIKTLDQLVSGRALRKRTRQYILYPPDARRQTLQWLLQHSSHPYPTKDEVECLLEQTGVDTIKRMKILIYNVRNRMLTKDDGVSCLMISAENGHLEMVNALLEAGGRELLMLAYFNLYAAYTTKHQTAGTVRVTRPPLAKRKKQLAPRSVFI